MAVESRGVSSAGPCIVWPLWQLSDRMSLAKLRCAGNRSIEKFAPGETSFFVIFNNVTGRLSCNYGSCKKRSSNRVGCLDVGFAGGGSEKSPAMMSFVLQNLINFLVQMAA